MLILISHANNVYKDIPSARPSLILPETTYKARAPQSLEIRWILRTRLTYSIAMKYQIATKALCPFGISIICWTAHLSHAFRRRANRS